MPTNGRSSRQQDHYLTEHLIVICCVCANHRHVKACQRCFKNAERVVGMVSELL